MVSTSDDTSMARTLAISNQKGGVGKTTTAVNLAAALALSGRKVLVVDADPQGNASSGLGHSRDDVSMGLYDLILGFRELSSVLQPTSVEGLDLVPATRDLIGADVELVDQERREWRLHKALADARAAYDDILIDCPPSLSLLTVNALVAADAVLIPLQAEFYAMEGLGELLRTIKAVQRGLNPRLTREGLLITMHDARNNLCKEVETQARALFGDEVFATVIPRNVRLGEAPSYGRSILEYDRRSAGATAYQALASELLQRRHRAAP